MPHALWELLADPRRPSAAQARALWAQLGRPPHPGVLLAETAVRCAGTPEQRHVLDAHLKDAPWCGHMRLDLQPYEALLPDDEGFDAHMRQALAVSPVGARHLAALRTGKPAAVTALRKTVDALTAQAVTAAQKVKALRAMIGPQLHVLQAMALQRTLAVLPSPRGLCALEVGPQDGGLMRALQAHGMDVEGVDLEPRVEGLPITRGDFMTVDLRHRFHLVVATAVFEFGSGWVHPMQPGRGDVALLRRLRELLMPGGVVVLENIGYPVPFSAAAAREEGLVPVRGGLCHHLSEGGRGATLRAVGNPDPHPA